MARWQIGDAAECKSAEAGSIPALASRVTYEFGQETKP